MMASMPCIPNAVLSNICKSCLDLNVRKDCPPPLTKTKQIWPTARFIFFSGFETVYKVSQVPKITHIKKRWADLFSDFKESSISAFTVRIFGFCLLYFDFCCCGCIFSPILTVECLATIFVTHKKIKNTTVK